jgi:hypothetical protein
MCNSGGKLLNERSLVRPIRRWKDNIKMDLKEVVCVNGRWVKVY